MLIFLTPHVIDDESDLEEVYRVKVAQRQEFIRRFYGKSRQQQEDELEKLLQYSMNHIDKPSVYRGNERAVNNWEVIGSQASTGCRTWIHRPQVPLILLMLRLAPDLLQSLLEV